MLLYSPADVVRLERLHRTQRRRGRGAARSGRCHATAAGTRAAAPHAALRRRARLPPPARCPSTSARPIDATNCGACDVCLDEVEGVADATVTAQKILSCVARAGEGFGVMHIVDILVGADTERIRQSRPRPAQHLRAARRRAAQGGVTAMVHQLIDQRLLERSRGDRPVLQAQRRLRGRCCAASAPCSSCSRAQGRSPKPRFDEDRGRASTRASSSICASCAATLADARGVPPYIIFGDATLRELARRRPTSLAGFAAIRGVGQKKLEDLGPVFLDADPRLLRRATASPGRGGRRDPEPVPDSEPREIPAPLTVNDDFKPISCRALPCRSPRCARAARPAPGRAR